MYSTVLLSFTCHQYSGHADLHVYATYFITFADGLYFYNRSTFHTAGVAYERETCVNSVERHNQVNPVL